MSEYLEKVLRATGGHAAPAENLEYGKKEAPEGYHYMPDGTLMRDDAHENEAAADDNPCWSGYKQVGMKKGKGGKMVPNCVPVNASIKDFEDKNPAPESYHYMLDGTLAKDFEFYGEISIAAAAGSKPAPEKDQIKGSSKNAKGSASSGKSITFSKNVETSLKKKAAEHNEKHGDTSSKKTSVRTLKAVYRRGAGAFSSSHRPGQNRNSWAMARVNAFLHLLRTGRPKNSKYVTDNDLLPATHAKSSKKNASSLTAAGLLVSKTVETMSSVEILPYEEYVSDEHAIFSLAEYSDLGYEVIPAMRAAWLRAQRDGKEPFERAALLASALYDSPDADLLPIRSEV